MEGLCPGVAIKGGLYQGGGSLSGRSPLYSNEREVRILLECILVCLAFASCEQAQQVRVRLY